MQTTRATFGGASTWTLTGRHAVQAEASAANDNADVPAEDSPLAVTTPPKTWRVPISTDIYGRPNEYVQVSDLQAAGHWDQRQWERIE